MHLCIWICSRSLPDYWFPTEFKFNIVWNSIHIIPWFYHLVLIGEEWTNPMQWLPHHLQDVQHQTFPHQIGKTEWLVSNDSSKATVWRCLASQCNYQKHNERQRYSIQIPVYSFPSAASRTWRMAPRRSTSAALPEPPAHFRLVLLLHPQFLQDVAPKNSRQGLGIRTFLSGQHPTEHLQILRILFFVLNSKFWGRATAVWVESFRRWRNTFNNFWKLRKSFNYCVQNQSNRRSMSNID